MTYLSEVDQRAIFQLRDTYPIDEYDYRLERVAGFLVVTVRLQEWAAEELEQVPRDIVYHVDVSGRAKLGEVIA